MSGLKTEIIENTMIGSDSLCLDYYHDDGSVRLICDEDLQEINDHGVCVFKRRAMVCLSKKEMLKLCRTYLKNLEDDEEA